jgi:hypothetical protein
MPEWNDQNVILVQLASKDASYYLDCTNSIGVFITFLR